METTSHNGRSKLNRSSVPQAQKVILQDASVLLSSSGVFLGHLALVMKSNHVVPLQRIAVETTTDGVHVWSLTWVTDQGRQRETTSRLCARLFAWKVRENRRESSCAPTPFPLSTRLILTRAVAMIEINRIYSSDISQAFPKYTALQDRGRADNARRTSGNGRQLQDETTPLECFCATSGTVRSARTDGQL